MNASRVYLTALAGIDETTCGTFSKANPITVAPSSYTPASRFTFHDHFTPSDIAKEASERCLQLARITSKEIDYVISCTQTPDFNNPSLVSSLLAKLGGVQVPGIEIRQGAAGALYALDIAHKLIISGSAQCVLVVATEFLSRYFGGITDTAPLSDGARLAANVMADGAAAFLAVSEKLLSKFSHCASYGFEGMYVAHAGEKRKSFWCHLPSASQFPTRLTVEDVAQCRHLPELIPWELSSGIRSAVMRVPVRSLGIVSPQQPPHFVVSHEIMGGMNELLATVLGLDKGLLRDIFTRHGHIGAAGLPRALLDLKIERGARGALLAVTSGVSFAMGALERM